MSGMESTELEGNMMSAPAGGMVLAAALTGMPPRGDMAPVGAGITIAKAGFGSADKAVTSRRKTQAGFAEAKQIRTLWPV